jgi:hypothetical protein
MNDQDLEIRLREHYRSLDPSVAPAGLVARIDGALDRSPGRRGVLLRMPAFAMGLAAVAIAAVLAVTLVPGMISGPATPSPSASPSSSPTASPSPAGSRAVTPAPSLPGGTMPPVTSSGWQNIEVQPVAGIGQPDQVVASSGGYLALGDPQSQQGAVPAWVSGDGRTWAPLPGDPFGQVTTIVAAPIADGVVVLATGTDGTGLAWRSTDGLTWTPIAAPGQRNLDPGYVAGSDSGVIVAVEGQPAAVEWSVDGASWQTVSMPGGSHARVTGVAVSGDRFVAVGHVFAVPDEPIAWWSSDGITWNRAQVESRPGEAFVAVQGAADGLVAQSQTIDLVPGSATHWASADRGRTWWIDTIPLGTIQGQEGSGNPNGMYAGDGSRLLGYAITAPGRPTEYWVSPGDNSWTHLTLTGDTTEAEGGPDLGLYPLLLRDGILFVGPDRAWLGTPWYSG